MQAPLLIQLRQLSKPASSGSDAGVRTAPGSKPPGSLLAADMLGEIRRETRECRELLAGEPRVLPSRIAVELRELVSLTSKLEQGDERASETACVTRRMVRRARVLLGYDAPMRQLRDTVCGNCGGALIVRADADSDVRCIGHPEAESCGTIYRRYQWIDLLDQQSQCA